jgi:hypothetical protein
MIAGPGILFRDHPEKGDGSDGGICIFKIGYDLWLRKSMLRRIITPSFI